jgi:signal transduction histidine kinase
VLYTVLFAVCGAITVAVSYTLVAQLRVPQQPSPASAGVSAGFAALCRSAYLRGDKSFLGTSSCPWSILSAAGAQAQRTLTLTRLLQFSLITLGVVIVLAAILGWILSGRALHPVHKITAAARAASEHNLSARVTPAGPRDELRELAETFDEMLERLQATFGAQEQFIANASHELRTPLAVMRTTIDVTLGNPDSTPAELRTMAADIRAEVDNAEHLIAALLILARNTRGLTVHEEVDLATVVEDLLDSTEISERQVHATLDPAVITGDRVLAERLIANLLDNAVRYNVTGGHIWITTGTASGRSRLSVANTGPVVTPTDADRIFTPFQRLDNRTAHDGFGLGLAIVASIAEVHGGTVVARPRADGGLSVTLTIPSAGDPAQDNATQAPGREVFLSQADARPSW